LGLKIERTTRSIYSKVSAIRRHRAAMSRKCCLAVGSLARCASSSHSLARRRQSAASVDGLSSMATPVSPDLRRVSAVAPHMCRRAWNAFTGKEMLCRIHPESRGKMSVGSLRGRAAGSSWGAIAGNLVGRQAAPNGRWGLRRRASGPAGYNGSGGFSQNRAASANFDGYNARTSVPHPLNRLTSASARRLPKPARIRFVARISVLLWPLICHRKSLPRQCIRAATADEIDMITTTAKRRLKGFSHRCMRFMLSDCLSTHSNSKPS